MRGWGIGLGKLESSLSRMHNAQCIMHNYGVTFGDERNVGAVNDRPFLLRQSSAVYGRLIIAPTSIIGNIDNDFNISAKPILQLCIVHCQLEKKSRPRATLFIVSVRDFGAGEG